MGDYTNDLIFLDFEGSSLGKRGWPVEIGLSWLADDGTIESHARLIRRFPLWSMDDWNERSAAVHGIPYRHLEEEGIEAPNAAAWFIAMTRGRRVGSDAPRWERPWLRRCLEIERDPSEVEAQLARVVGFDDLVDPLLSDRALDAFFEKLERVKAAHRAGPDSARFAKALKAAFDRR